MEYRRGAPDESGEVACLGETGGITSLDQ